jgi:hypothetical protein
MKKITLIICAILLISCAPTKQFVAFSHDKMLDNNKGRIYVIKPSFVGSAVKTAIFCNDILIGNTINGSYLCWDIEEGTYVLGNTQFAHNGTTLGAGSGEDVFKINVKKGKTYYLRLSPHFGGLDFEILDTKRGEREIKGRKKPKLNYIE